jgi:hypothetical protein
MIQHERELDLRGSPREQKRKERFFRFCFVNKQFFAFSSSSSIVQAIESL